ncbi:MAG: hypothetical protein CL694_08450 [Chloroflexi bacterium]|nr:hypothetical protein [Chloroflexota bacterium]HAL47581.1 hypothetical protein [Dehalococcoidia bacterium]
MPNDIGTSTGVCSSIAIRGASLMFRSTNRLPRFTMSNNIRPEALARSTGKMIDTSDENSTSPSAFRGASPTSVIRAFESCSGSTANRNVPRNSS